MKNLRLEVYMMTQKECLEYAKNEFLEKGIDYNEDVYGNVWSIKHKDKPIFVAHCDTVIGSDENYKKELKIEGDRLTRPGFVLGADDRAGVSLILNHADKINFILTVDEEIGAIGAEGLVADSRFLKDLEIGTFFIELDRKGKNDIIGSEHGYCNKNVVTEIKKVLPKYKENYGVFTDIDAWTSIRQGVNISVGYEGAHTITEYLCISHFEYVNSKIIELSEISNPEFRDVVPESSRPYKFSGFINTGKYGGTSSYRYCSFCGALEKGMTEIDGDHYCDSCLDYLKFEGVDITAKKPKELKCGVCGGDILEGEWYIDVRDWDIKICQDCYSEKRNFGGKYGL